MQLKLRRSQRTGGVLGTTAVFCLDARIDLAPEERQNIQRYKLGGQVIYNSQASRRHVEAGNAAGAQGSYLKSIASFALARLNLNITINSLERGQHIECKDLDELLSAEEALMDACQMMKGYLDAAATFDGREVVFDFSQRDPTATVNVLPLEPPRPISSEPSPVPPESPAPDNGAAAPAAPETYAYEFAPAASPAAVNEFGERLKYYWHSRTVGQKWLLGVGGLVAFYILAHIL